MFSFRLKKETCNHGFTNIYICRAYVLTCKQKSILYTQECVHYARQHFLYRFNVANSNAVLICTNELVIRGNGLVWPIREPINLFERAISWWK